MGLAETFRAGVDTAFRTLGNEIEEVTYRQRTTGGSYDPSTGALSTAVVDTTLSVFFDVYKLRERENSAIQPEDRRAMIKGSSIDFTPAIGDQLVRVFGGTWHVIAVISPGGRDDPAGAALWELQVRRPS